MATYVNNLRLKEITTGDEDGTWGTSTNTNLELITDGFSYGTKEIAADANETFTMPDATADATRSLYLKFTSAVDLTATREITLGPNTVSKTWIIENATTGGQIITIKQGSGATVNVPNGSKVMVVTDGAGAGAAVFNANPTEVGGTVTSVGGTGTVNGLTLTGTVTTSGNLTLGGTLANVDLTSQVTGTLPIANGGTGSTSTTYVDLTTNVTGTLPVANGGTGVTSSTGTGSVVLSSSPTLTTPNLGTPSAATLTNATGLPLATGVTGQLPLANGGTGASLVDPDADRILFWDDSAGSTAFLTVGSGLQISGTTLSTTDSGGTVTSVDVSGGTTGLTTSGGPITGSGTITLAGTLAVANGGTGVTTSTGSGSVVLSTAPTLEGIVTLNQTNALTNTSLSIVNTNDDKGTFLNFIQHRSGGKSDANFAFGHGGDDSGDIQLRNQSSTNIKIYQNSVEKIRIVPQGYFIAPEGIVLGTDLSFDPLFDSSHTLDDYEEGTFTPVVDFSTTSPTSGATSGTGSYVKIGQEATVWGTVTNFNVTGAVGNINVTGLPFTAKANASLVLYVGTIRTSQVNIANSYLSSEVRDGESFVRIMEMISNADAAELTAGDFTDGTSDIFFTLTYETT